MATNMVDVLDMTEDELEAELLRQLENMSEDEDEEQQLNYNNNNKTNILKKYEDEENVPPPSSKTTSSSFSSVSPPSLPNAPPVSSWNLLMSSVDQSSSMLKSYEENIGEAFQLTIKTNTNNDDGGNNNTATNNDNDVMATI